MKLQSNRAPSADGTWAKTLATLLLVAGWFGIVTGLVEGIGLLLFQRINWARWGATIHFSQEIIWISMLVDVALFLVLALILGLLMRVIERFPPVKVVVFLLTALAAYDWLTLTGRLHFSSCLLLSIGAGAAFTRWMHKHEIAVLQFWKRTLPWIATAGVLILIGIQGGRWLQEATALRSLPPAAADAPNVLVIVIDTLRADHLSAYGYSRPTSPNIDRLARQGTLFENAIAAGSWSLPSHVSMLTGRYQFEHGVGDIAGTPIHHWNTPGLGGYPSLGEALQQRGYRTGAFSANRTYFSQNLGFGRSFLHFEDYFHSPADSFVRTLYGGELAGLYLSAIRNGVTVRALRFLGCESLMDGNFEGAGGLTGAHVRKRATVVNQELLQWIGDGPQPRPFFAFLNYFDVHNPYGGPPSYPKPAWQQKTSIDQYDDSVKYVDDAIGELMAQLEKRGLTQKTIVVITSDHGESLGQHWLAYHGHALYRELIQVPLILWSPGHVPAGLRVPTPVTNAALPATVMSLLGTGGAGPFPRQPLDALWKVPQDKPDTAGLISELAEENFLEAEDEGADRQVPLGTAGAMKSLLASQWHLIVHKKFGNQLYDWIHDPAESTNLIHTPEGQEIARRLMGHMEDLLTGTPAGAQGTTSAVALRQATLERSDQLVRSRQAAVAVNDYYRLSARPGSTLAIEVRPQPVGFANPMDSVVAILDTNGEPLETCRDPEDDHTETPGMADPTPDAFDDICINDDVNPGVQTESRLEILVPGSGQSPVELYLRVSDWNGRVGPGMQYQIAVTVPVANPAIKAAVQ